MMNAERATCRYQVIDADDLARGSAYRSAMPASGLMQPPTETASSPKSQEPAEAGATQDAEYCLTAAESDRIVASLAVFVHAQSHLWSTNCHLSMASICLAGSSTGYLPRTRWNPGSALYLAPYCGMVPPNSGCSRESTAPRSLSIMRHIQPRSSDGPQVASSLNLRWGSMTAAPSSNRSIGRL